VRKENGIYKSYYNNGQLCVEVNYIDGKKIEVNYIDGKKVEVNYIDGKEV
jgi:antitoxin component YwqK of YwqJK toxin-antitoxin module